MKNYQQHYQPLHLCQLLSLPVLACFIHLAAHREWDVHKNLLTIAPIVYILYIVSQESEVA